MTRCMIRAVLFLFACFELLAFIVLKRGQVLGLVGNTGNSVAPHLHFQLMGGPSSLASNGMPYEIDGFQVTAKRRAPRHSIMRKRQALRWRSRPSVLRNPFPMVWHSTSE